MPPPRWNRHSLASWAEAVDPIEPRGGFPPEDEVEDVQVDDASSLDDGSSDGWDEGSDGLSDDDDDDDNGAPPERNETPPRPK